MTKGIVNIEQYINQGYKEKTEPIDILPGENTRFDFPTDKYKIIGHIYKFDNNVNKYWDVSSYDILKYNNENNTFENWMSFGRNYHLLDSDMFAYCIQNDKEFLITSSNYQYLTVLNLTDKEIKSYSYGNPEIGNGFCPVSIEYFQSDYDNELHVYGCFWGAPYSTLIFKNVDLNDLSESYNINNCDVKVIGDDDSDNYDIEDILNDDELDRYDQFKLNEEMIYNTIKVIKNDQYSNLSIKEKEYFNDIIIKALSFYFNNIL